MIFIFFYACMSVTVIVLYYSVLNHYTLSIYLLFSFSWLMFSPHNLEEIVFSFSTLWGCVWFGNRKILVYLMNVLMTDVISPAFTSLKKNAVIVLPLVNCTTVIFSFKISFPCKCVHMEIQSHSFCSFSLFTFLFFAVTMVYIFYSFKKMNTWWTPVFKSQRTKKKKKKKPP